MADKPLTERAADIKFSLMLRKLTVINFSIEFYIRRYSGYVVNLGLGTVVINFTPNSLPDCQHFFVFF